MRSTVDLQPHLNKQLRAAAEKAGLTFKDALNRVVAAGLHTLSDRPQKNRPPYQIKAKECGLAPGIDQDKLNQLYDQLESEQLETKSHKDPTA